MTDGPSNIDRLVGDIRKEFGEEIKSSTEFCEKLWSSFTNTSWYYDGIGVDMSFRYVAKVIAGIRGSQDPYGYMEWYCSESPGKVDPEIAERMSKIGWTYRV